MTPANSPPDVDRALVQAAGLFSGTLEGEPRYGWRRKSAGSRLRVAQGQADWLRVQFAEEGQINEKTWDGEVLASKFDLKAKPRLYQARDWIDSGYAWRATLSAFVPFPVCSSSPELRSELLLSDDWFNGLRGTLSGLEGIRTERVCCRQDLITRRVQERFGDVDARIEQWVTCHGDVHWANLTSPELYLLDWEVWGLGPKGLDPAFLLGFSGLLPKVQKDVWHHFADLLSTRDGRICVLFVCAELLRMIELYDDHPDLRRSLDELASATLAAMGR